MFVFNTTYQEHLHLIYRTLHYPQIAFSQNVFANEMTRSTDLCLNFPSFEVSVPKHKPTHDNKADSGVYVIRHMQHHGRNWYTHVRPLFRTKYLLTHSKLVDVLSRLFTIRCA